MEKRQLMNLTFTELYEELRMAAARRELGPVLDAWFEQLNSSMLPEPRIVKMSDFMMRLAGKAIKSTVTHCDDETEVRVTFNFETNLWHIFQYCPDCIAWFQLYEGPKQVTTCPASALMEP
jgi:hypothetical protein